MEARASHVNVAETTVTRSSHAEPIHISVPQFASILPSRFVLAMRSRDVWEQALKQRVAAFAAPSIRVGPPTCDTPPTYITHPEFPSTTIHQHPSVLISTHLYPSAPICTHQHPSVPICTHLYPPAPICTHLHPSAPICTHLYPSAPICTHLHPSAPICTHQHPAATSTLARPHPTRRLPRAQ